MELARRGELGNDDDVASILSYLGEPRIGTHVMCPAERGHAAPFRFFADVLLGRVGDFVCWANRGGSKSYIAGLLTWIDSYRIAGLSTTILGGSLDQSEKAYEAMNSCWGASGFQDEYLEGDPTRRLTKWKCGSQVKILTASQRSVRGPHPHRLFMDEIDEMAEDIYEAALSQPQSGHGIRGVLGRFSTNHHFGGIMDTAINQAEVAGVPVFKWCVWESLESCRDYSCSTCPLDRFCPGPQMKRADGYYKFEDLLQKLRNLSETVFRVEWLCEKLQRSDLVYGVEFDEELLSPLDLPSFSPALPVSVSIDWGGSNPFSVGFWQLRPFGWLRFAEYYKGETTNTRVLDACSKFPWWKNVRDGVADPSRPDLIKEWEDEETLKRNGFKITPAENAVDPGIEATKNCMRPIVGPPRFLVSRSCQDWRKEVKGYAKDKRTGKPIKRNDHAQDETRYFVMWKLAAEIGFEGFVYVPGQKAEAAAPEEEKIEKPKGMAPAAGTVPEDKKAEVAAAEEEEDDEEGGGWAIGFGMK